MSLKDKIKQLVDKHYNQTIEIRRHLHEYPELSFQEYETSKYIVSILKNWGIEYQEGIANTGILCFIKGKNPGKRCIALRADMDALPIEEINELPFKSKNKGVMHACGHDAHTASLLGVICILNELKDSFEGTVKCIFQPAEEKLPGGAKQMIDEGVLNNPRPELIIGQHVYPEFMHGTTGFKKGAYMASSDEIYLTIKGKGGHGAMPDKLTDTVLIASHIIVALQQIVSRMAPQGIPTVLSFGKVIANGATNIIPNEVYIEGTFRTMNEEWRKKVHEKIKLIACSTAEGMGASVDVNIVNGYPVLINNKEATQNAIEFAKDFLGDENVKNLDFRMTSEDFAYYSQHIPSVFYRLGTSENNEKYSPLHSPGFKIAEEALKTGIGTMAYMTMQFLKH